MLFRMLDALGYLAWPIAVMIIIVALAYALAAAEQYYDRRDRAFRECINRHPVTRSKTQGVPWQRRP